MFTGIVQKGNIHAIHPNEEGWELVLEMPTFAKIVQLGSNAEQYKVMHYGLLSF